MVRHSYSALVLGAAVLVLGLSGVARAADKDEKKADSGKGKIAVFRLGVVTEKPADESFPFSGGLGGISLKDLVARLKKASEDPAVKAVVLMPAGTGVGSAQMEEVREAMAKFRNAGKDIFVHADSLGMREYVLYSGASRISVVPTGDLWITGLYGEAMYLRGLLNKIGVKPDFLTCGAYKSAAEMFMREEPSPEAEKMQNWLLDSLYDTFVQLIAKGRKVDADKVKAWIDGGPYTAEKAMKAGLIDAVEQRQEFEAILKSKFGKDVTFDKKYGDKKMPKIDFNSPFAMLNIWAELLGDTKKKKSGKTAVGIVYVEGPIVLGGNSGNPFLNEEAAASTAIRKALDEAAKDDSIKAVVLRVNSPGGSAVASDIILDATKRVKARKPFVVSMGNVAGSGGYYVACGADVIFADKATITGSIGVVSGKLVTNPMWNKIGVTFKTYKRGENAGMLSSSDTFSKVERERMQGLMDEIYGVFKKHVTDIRGKKLKKDIDELAGGRVYTGEQALELGLVDKIGSMEDAIAYVAKEAKLDHYDVRPVPEPKNFMEQILEELSGDKDDDKGKGLSARPPAGAQQTNLVDLAMPYLKHLDPQRAKAITNALRQLQLLQREGVIMMMPEMILAP